MSDKWDVVAKHDIDDVENDTTTCVDFVPIATFENIFDAIEFAEQRRRWEGPYVHVVGHGYKVPRRARQYSKVMIFGGAVFARRAPEPKRRRGRA